jgi:ATP dependent DNA ligase domain
MRGSFSERIRREGLESLVCMESLFSGVSASKTGCRRHQITLPRIYCARSREPIERVPSGERWIHEIKFDAYRVQVHLHNSEIRIFTRRGHDWTHRFRKIAGDGYGEVVVP